MGLTSGGGGSGETKIGHTAVQDMQLIVQETPGAPPMSSGGGGGYGYGGSGGYGSSRTAVTSTVASSNLLDKYSSGGSGFDSGGSGGIVEDQYGVRYDRSNSPAYRPGSSGFGSNSSADRDIASLTAGASAKSDYSYDRPRGAYLLTAYVQCFCLLTCSDCLSNEQ